MGLLDRMIGNAIARGVGQVANQVANQAANQVGKQIKDSGVIESTIDDMANKITGGTKFAKIMKCPFCGVEYDNTLTNCPGCGAANENRKYDYQAHKDDNKKTISGVQAVNPIQGSMSGKCAECMYCIEIEPNCGVWNCNCGNSSVNGRTVIDTRKVGGTYLGLPNCNCFTQR